jgi:PAT family beta-lactamase induction signal transducer AmpG
MTQEIKKSYLDKRILFIFLNGIASGFPWVIIGSAMTLWLKDAGLTRTAIGFFGSIFFVYSINWLWAPFLDKIRLPLAKKLGRRRSWLIALQAILFALIIALSFTNPSISIIWVSLLGLLVAIVSATQDIVIDAYRIDIIDKDDAGKIAAGSAMATSGWWVGFGFIGAFTLYLADSVENWSIVYLITSLFVALFIFNTLQMPKEIESEKKEQPKFNLDFLISTFVDPLKDYFLRYGKTAILILLFIMFFKIGEAFLGKMSLVFYDEIGFSKSDIATYSKLLGSTLTIIFSIIASFFTIRFGLVKGLIIGGVAMAATNLMYSYLAVVGADKEFLALTIFLDNFTSAFSTVAFVAFISHLVNKSYTATQYALMSSMGNLGKTLFASSSGLLVDGLDGNWFVFFIITAVMVVPSLIMLGFIAKKLKSIKIL